MKEETKMQFSPETLEYMNENDVAVEDVLAIVAMIDEQTEGMWVHDSKITTTHVMAFSHAWTLASDETQLLHAVNSYAAIQALEDAHADFEETCFGHWSYPNFDTLAVRVLDDTQTTVEVGAAVLAHLQNELEDYPVLNEEFYSAATFNVYQHTMIEEIDILDATPEVKHRTFQDWRDYSYEPEYDIEPSKEPLTEDDTKENWTSLTVWADNLNLNDLEELTSF